LLVQEGSIYRPTGEIPSLEVPETLHGLVASRLDGLPAEERRLLQDAAVLGKTFTRHALAVVGGVTEAELDPLLGSLARKEILGVQADPTSPEHGQYGFLQDLVRHVSYETLSKKERRSRHLAAAAHLEAAFANEDEIAEVIASHYLDAYSAQPDANDAEEVKAKAQAALVRAGDRAESLGAAGEALRYLEQASELTDDPLGRAALLDRAGWLATYAADWQAAERLLGESIGLYEENGKARSAARVSGRLASVEHWQGKEEAAVPRAEAAFTTLEAYEPGEELAGLAAALAGGYFFRGETEKALEKAELAIELAESLGSPEILARAFSAKALATHGGRPEEAIALRRHVLAIAREHGLHELEGNALFNLSDLMFQRDRYDDALAYLADALSSARRAGNRPAEWSLLGETTYPLSMLGRWDEALAAFAEVPDERLLAGVTEGFLSSLPEIHRARGEIERAAQVVSLWAANKDSENVQRRVYYLAGAAVVARAESRLEDALRVGTEVVELSRYGGEQASQALKLGIVEAIEAALAIDDTQQAEALVASIEAIPPGLRAPYLGAQALRFRARLPSSDDAALEGFEAAAKRFGELKIPFWLAVTELEQAERLVSASRGSEAESLLAETREIFEQLEAIPWLERADALARKLPEPVPVSG
jgi:tetratricopeptide (TPR) repeat protein